MDIKDSLLFFTAGLILLTTIYQIVSWKFTVVVMFFWLCYKFDVVYQNQKIITTNQSNLEKLIRKEIK